MSFNKSLKKKVKRKKELAKEEESKLAKFHKYLGGMMETLAD